MTIFKKLQKMDAARRMKLLGSTSLTVRAMERATEAQCAREDWACPAALRPVLFGDDRPCEALGRSKGQCRSCARAFLMSEWPEELPDDVFWD